MDKVDHAGRTTFAVSVSFVTLATIATGLRLLTRNVIKKRFQADDWLILGALASLFVFAAMTIWAIIVGGGGQDLSSPILHYEEVQKFLKATFITAPFYLGLLTLVRLSLTALYRRIFNVKKFRTISFAIDGIVIAWCIFGVVLTIFACTPVDFFWNPLGKGSCITWYNKFVLGFETIGIVLDTVILALPVRMIVTLQMSFRNKVLLSGIFLLGGFVIITNIVRLVLVHSSSGTYINFTQNNVWSMIHACTAVVCASLPTYKPLFPKMAGIYRHLRSRYSTLLLRTQASSKSEGTVEDLQTVAGKARYAEIADGGIEGRYLTKAEATTGSVDHFGESGYPLNSIEVNKTVEVV